MKVIGGVLQSFRGPKEEPEQMRRTTLAEGFWEGVNLCSVYYVPTYRSCKVGVEDLLGCEHTRSSSGWLSCVVNLIYCIIFCTVNICVHYCWMGLASITHSCGRVDYAIVLVCRCTFYIIILLIL